MVLIGNAWTNAGRLPASLIKECAAHLPHAKGGAKWSRRIAFVGQLLGISIRSAQSWINQLQQNDWFPMTKESLRDWRQRRYVREQGLLAEEAEHQAAAAVELEAPEELAMNRLVRRALYSSFEHRTGLEWERDMASLALLCPNEFGGLCRGREFYTTCIHVGATVVRHLDGLDYDCVIPGIGIKSDVSLMLDPVSLGLGTFARNETCLVICAASVSPWTHRLRTTFLEGPTLCLEGHTGDSLRDLTLQTLQDHPVSLSLAALRSRLSAICGDGALCRGGSAAKHGSTGACEKIWEAVHIESGIDATHCSTWDRGLQQLFCNNY